ncbi:hypothetical protein BY996DRAFT_6418246 [Phakopsora pachyrhizi]|uniref:Peptidase C15, pyroglutamyl peptidase I-like protein n=1 Tax=Phakopsora pachyrhizi TaxID=170000 RepID=A0AAV0BMS4_PHAPC|nr:hypothetical protein BY996DRAFT_6419139 [Phakopsora pachyrhizi]KAI8449638.1 hypothetical protein BY996DRAFT_6418246 [Phakopsora pachyrhizi]CAH7688567.1 hypothetical protein PPACK8108_LOCUS23536 [Phakopsora pachyrhizi]
MASDEIEAGLDDDREIRSSDKRLTTEAMAGKTLYRVFLTGYGPFRDHSINSSFEIIKDLSNRRIRLNQGDLNDEELVEIEFKVYSDPIKVSYSTVRSLIPRIYLSNRQDSQEKRALIESLNGSEIKDQPSKYDLIIHLGLDNKLSKHSYSIENLAHRDGYKLADADGKFGNCIDSNDSNDWEDWSGSPELLKTSVDVDLIVQILKSKVPDANIRSSTDAGRYLCEYIYYASLCHHYSLKNSNSSRTKDFLPVLFLHVPSSIEDHQIEFGRKVLVETVKAVVNSHFIK